MKFFVNSIELASALNVVSKALTNKKNIPVLEGIKIVAEGDAITLTATDLDLFIETKIKAEIFTEGQAVVPGKFFAEYSRKLSAFERIEFEKMDNRHLMVRYGEARIDVQCFEEDTYPEVVQVDDNYSFKITEKALKDMLEKTIFSVAVDDSRPILKGCLLETREDTVSAVCLDGYRIAVCKKTIKEQKGDIKVIVSGRNLLEISKIFEEKDDIVTVDVQENNIKFDMGHTIITSRLMEGVYVNYKGVIPKEFNTTIIVKVKELIDCLERTALIARNKTNNSVKMIISNNQIFMSADSENASGKEVVVVNQKGEDITIAFNSKYIYEALMRVKEDYVKIEFVKSNAPAKIHPLDGEEFEYIIFSVRQVG